MRVMAGPAIGIGHRKTLVSLLKRGIVRVTFKTQPRYIFNEQPVLIGTVGIVADQTIVIPYRRMNARPGSPVIHGRMAGAAQCCDRLDELFRLR